MTGKYALIHDDGSRSTPKKLSKLLSKLPLLISFSILGGTWLAFTFTITIPEVLLRRQDIAHFTFQCIAFNGLMGLTVLSLLIASTRSPGHPDPALAPFNDNPGPDTPNPPMAQRSRTAPATLTIRDASANEEDTDDIPLKYLRNSQWVSSRVKKDRPSPLPLGPARSSSHHTGAETDKLENLDDLRGEDNDGEDESIPGISPFPLGISPFVPTTAEEAGDDSDWTDEEEFPDRQGDMKHDHRGEDLGLRLGTDTNPAGSSRGMRNSTRGYWMDTDALDSSGHTGPDTAIDLEEALDGIEAEIQTLLADQEQSSPNQHTERKSIERGRRGIGLMAKSTDGKPRWCKKCKGWKPDRCHHCRFCQRCVLKMDHHCVWLATCVGHQNYKPFLLFITYGTALAIYTAIEAGYQTFLFFTDTGVYSSPGAMEVEFAPVVFMLLTMIAGFFSLAIGGLTSYHWYLVCNNLTTLEQITHTYPTALLPPPPRSSSSGPSWKPEHLLSRSERRRLTEEAREINVYDLGWRRNIRQTLLGTDHQARCGGLMRDIGRAMWPLSKARNGDGHGFEYDEEKLGRLRRLTEELRVGKGVEDEEDEEDEG